MRSLRITLPCCWCALLFAGWLSWGCQPSRKTEAPNPAPKVTEQAPKAPPPQLLLTQAAQSQLPAAPSSVEADAGTTSRGVCTVAVVGDSLTDYRSGGGKFIRYLEKRCPKSRFDNYAKGGAMVNQMRRRFDELFTSDKPSYTHVVIYGGVNDLYSDLTAHRTNEKIQMDLSQMYDATKGAGARVIAMTVSPWGGFKRYFNQRRGKNTLALNNWIVGQQGTRVDVSIDTHPLLRCGDPDKLCPEYHTPFKDGLHIGPKGHEVLGAALYERVFHDCL